LIRHGQTDWNKASVFRGRADHPLNDTGWKEARAVAEALRDVSLDAVYASPLLRALGTVKYAAEERGLEVQPFPAVVDIDFGDWQGRPLSEVESQEAEDYRRWVEHPEQMVFPGGESLQETALRAADGVAGLVRKHPSGNIALCTHRVICKLLVLKLLSIDLSRFWQVKVDTASISTLFVEEGRWILEKLNADHHLSALAGERTTADF
jgi:broad specificity phosphatase PhoE